MPARRDSVIFPVRDTGIGIAPEDRSHLRRVRADPRAASSARARHRARAAAREEARRPARRRDRRGERGVAPRHDVHRSDPLGGGDQRRTAGAPMNSTSSVLVVDDDETARYVIEAHLRGSAWKVTGIASAEAALEAIAASSPAAIILDLTMPGLDGMEALRRLRDDPSTAGCPSWFTRPASSTPMRPRVSRRSARASWTSPRARAPSC